ncbi:GxxExxY protein [Candidatus Parcubacteria bacterium]|nr:GxxExxY protein [Patescibacteria group bacterium]MCG2686758.1 GxxExxY protein [Candidatus Parcubacteria bacterium]
MTRIKPTVELIYPNLSYKLTGIFYKIHNNLGRFYRERHYADEIERLFKDNKLSYKREFELSKLDKNNIKGNRVDFVVEDKIIVDIKAKKFITKEDYYQMLRYLKVANLKLGLIVNFRNTYLKPKRIVNIHS